MCLMVRDEKKVWGLTTVFMVGLTWSWLDAFEMASLMSGGASRLAHLSVWRQLAALGSNRAYRTLFIELEKQKRDSKGTTGDNGLEGFSHLE